MPKTRPKLARFAQAVSRKFSEPFSEILLCTGMSSSPETDTKTQVREEPSTKESNKTMRSSKIVFTLPLLLAAFPIGAATSFTGTGWLTGVPVPGILCTNGSGQAYLKGNVHTLRVLASDTNITGRLEAMPNVAFQSDGTRRFTGTAYSEVGTWDAATNFTASGGVWDLLYSGVTQTDGSVHYDIIGYGIGGLIDALRLELTADRGPGPTFDPSIPYQFSGTIKPAPVNTSLTLDDFNDGVLTNKWVPWSSGTPSSRYAASGTAQRLTLFLTTPAPTGLRIGVSLMARPSSGGRRFSG
jgi:hypothetical protein